MASVSGERSPAGPWGLGLAVGAYCVGRLGFELLRIDNATLIFGIRINVFTSVIVFLGALAYFIISARLRPGRETTLERNPEAVSELEEAAETK